MFTTLSSFKHFLCNSSPGQTTEREGTCKSDSFLLWSGDSAHNKARSSRSIAENLQSPDCGKMLFRLHVCSSCLVFFWCDVQPKTDVQIQNPRSGMERATPSYQSLNNAPRDQYNHTFFGPHWHMPRLAVDFGNCLHTTPCSIICLTTSSVRRLFVSLCFAFPKILICARLASALFFLCTNRDTCPITRPQSVIGSRAWFACLHGFVLLETDNFDGFLVWSHLSCFIMSCFPLVFL